uniref:Uncharacterized protein n=1 Tax=Timema poppense TaxID=170557 RepID=A0A7R9DBL8_TIMPO|nr:unnamed protein product [Timema poppensis]
MASKKGLSADEIASILEEQVGLPEAEIYITPTDNPLLSDEDSGDEEETNFDHLSGNQLKAVSEARITKVVSGEIVTEEPAATKQITDQRETFLVEKNDTANVIESSKADSSEENLNEARKNIDSIATTEENSNQSDVYATDKTDTKNQAADGKLLMLEESNVLDPGLKNKAPPLLHRSQAVPVIQVKEANLKLSMILTHTKTGTLISEESSEDEFQKDIMAPTRSSSYARKISKVTAAVSTPDVTHSASTVSQTLNQPVTSTLASNNNAGPNIPDLKSVASTPVSTSNTESSVSTTVNILSPVKKAGSMSVFLQ